MFNKNKNKSNPENVWARPKMSVTFRLEVMPGRSRADRTFRIEKVSPNGRVTLEGFPGEHRQGAFEPLEF